MAGWLASWTSIAANGARRTAASMASALPRVSPSPPRKKKPKFARKEIAPAIVAVSVATAWAMAQGALENSGADVAVAITGIAGPGGSEFKPEGRVCFGVAQHGRETRVETVDFGPLGRDKVRKAATGHALKLLVAALE